MPHSNRWELFGEVLTEFRGSVQTLSGGAVSKKSKLKELAWDQHDWNEAQKLTPGGSRRCCSMSLLGASTPIISLSLSLTSKPSNGVALASQTNPNLGHVVLGSGTFHALITILAEKE